MNIITKIEEGKRNKDRVNIYIDNDYAFSVSKEILYKESLKVNDNVNIEDLREIVKKDNYIKCKNSALRIVERSYKSERELKDKLLLKGYDKDSIEKTMAFLKEYNFLSDNNYTKMYVKDKSKVQGKNKIKFELYRKGISEEIIQEELSSIDEEDEKEVAYNLALKKYNVISKRESDKYKLSQKLYRYILSKGYSYDIASYAIKKVLDNI